MPDPTFTTEHERKRQAFSTIVLADPLPAHAGKLPLFLPTQTPHNQRSSLEKAAAMLRSGVISEICIIDNLGPSRPGYPGAPVWLAEFQKLGVSEEDITLAPFEGPLLTTLTEAFAMAGLAQRKGWEQLIIAAPESHLVRCMLSFISVVRSLTMNLRVYAQVGVRLRMFGERVQHSQNRWFDDRSQIIELELESTEKYMTNGTPIPLVIYATALEYIKWRDS